MRVTVILKYAAAAVWFTYIRIQHCSLAKHNLLHWAKRKTSNNTNRQAQKPNFWLQTLSDEQSALSIGCPLV